MKTAFRHAAAILLCLALCLGLTGCRADLGTVLKLRKMGKALEEVQDLSFSLNAAGHVLLSGQETSLTLGGDGAFRLSPTALAMEGEGSLGGLVSVQAPVAVTMDETRLDAFVGLALFENQPWLRVASAELPQTGLSLSSLMTLLGGSGAAELIKGEKGAREQQVRVTLPGSLIDPALTEEIVVDLWLDSETNLPSRIGAELAPLLRAMLDESARDMLDPLELYAEITVTAVNTAPALRLPQPGDEILDIGELALPAAG